MDGDSNGYQDQNDSKQKNAHHKEHRISYYYPQNREGYDFNSYRYTLFLSIVLNIISQPFVIHEPVVKSF